MQKFHICSDKKTYISYKTKHVLKEYLEMCLEITYLAIPKYPEISLNALKTGQNETSYILQQTGIPEIHVWLFENLQNL